MSRPYWTAKHVGTGTLLPKKLTKGRAYFVEDEQVIVVDHGDGPITYGGKPGPQGQAGEPIPQLQDQIDKLAEASLRTLFDIWYLHSENRAARETSQQLFSDPTRAIQEQIYSLKAQTESQDIHFGQVQDQIDHLAHGELQTLLTLMYVKETLTETHSSDRANLESLLSDVAGHLQDQIDHLTHGELQTLLFMWQMKQEHDSRLKTLQDKLNEYEAELLGLKEQIADLPSTIVAEEHIDPLDNETITTDAGTWKIEQTYLEDGKILLELDAEELFIDVLTEGDKISYDGTEWIVTGYEVNEDGSISMKLQQG